MRAWSFAMGGWWLMASAFVIRMTVREVRSSWRRLLFFFICIAIGVASIVTLRSVIQSVRGALAHQAREMLGADLLLSSGNPFPPALRTAADVARRDQDVTRVSEAVELITMARPDDPARTVTRLVELRAVDATFPIRGAIRLGEGTYRHALLEQHGALVRPEVLAQLGLSVGDSLRIGDASFTIRGVVTAEPNRNLGNFSVGPRVFIDRADLPATGLLSVGSRATFQLLFEVPDQALDPLAARWREAFAEQFVSVRSYRRSEDQMGENFDRAENYLSLVGLVVLILGGIGVSSVTRVFVQQKVRSIAILKCLGASGGQVLTIYLTQVFTLALAGCLLGVALAAGVIAAVPLFLGAVPLTVPVVYALTLSAVFQGVLIGLLVSMVFAVVPLLDVRAVKPALLLRQDTGVAETGRGVRLMAIGVSAVVMVSIAIWQAGSLQVGLGLVVGMSGVGLVLHGAGLVLVRALRPLRHTGNFALRQAVIHLVRPGSQAGVILLAVGLGTFFILGIRAIQTNLLQDFSVQAGPESPDMFLLDVQADQREAVSTFIAQRNDGAGAPVLVPVLRARVGAVRGKAVNLENVQDVRGRGSLAREYTVTYRAALEANETVIAGQWWAGPAAPGAEAEVSVEESLRDRYQIQPGDVIRFDVLGRPLTARVTSVRHVDWKDFRSGGFMFVFRPGAFDGAPHTFMSTAKGPSDLAARSELVAGLVDRFPNVSVIDLRETMQTIQGMVRNVTFGISVVGGLVLFSGTLILVGAVSMTKFRRVYEAAILKTLGATTRLVATSLLLEYGLLGAIAGTVGALGALALSWWLSVYILDMPWLPNPALSMAGIGVTAVAASMVGVLASLDVLRGKPLSTLRAE